MMKSAPPSTDALLSVKLLSLIVTLYPASLAAPPYGAVLESNMQSMILRLIELDSSEFDMSPP